MAKIVTDIYFGYVITEPINEMINAVILSYSPTHLGYTYIYMFI
jgi:hypothetical protein